MGVTLFFTNKGYNPNIMFHPERDLVSSRAREFVTNLDELHTQLQENMTAAQLQYQVSADATHTRALAFPIGSRAYVKAQFFQTTCPSKKLADKFLGPYEVIAQPGTHSVTLRLLDSLRAVHPVFHISMLEPATASTIPGCFQPPPPPVYVDNEPEFEVAEVLDSKLDNHQVQCKLLYLVQWTGYEGTDKETSWILATELGNAPELVADYHAAYPAKPGPLNQV